jgi:hypothetical protein
MKNEGRNEKFENEIIWKLETGNWKLEIDGNWKLEIGN